MRKLIVLISVATIISGCSLLPANNNIEPTPTGNYVEPTKPAGEVKHKFSSSDAKIDLYYVNAKYIYFGTVTLPNPCYKVTVSSTIAESFPEQVTLNIVTQASDEICIQVIDERKIAGEIEVSEGAKFTILLNGESVDEQ